MPCSRVFLLGCSDDSPNVVDPQTSAEEASLVTAEAVKSFRERFTRDVRIPEVVQIPRSINIDEVASLMRPEFTLQHVQHLPVRHPTGVWSTSARSQRTGRLLSKPSLVRTFLPDHSFSGTKKTAHSCPSKRKKSARHPPPPYLENLNA